MKKADSFLPSDPMTQSLGSNYGLDGFDFDSDYGEGVLQSDYLPEAHGMARLPDGIIKSAAPYDDATGVVLGEPEGSFFGTEGNDLEGMMSENSLAELGWLNGIQDPDRLPKSPVDQGILELQEAWSKDRLASAFIPNQDKVALYSNKEAELSEYDLQKIVRQAQRRSAFGEPLSEILHTAAQQAAHQAPQLKQAMQALRAEHGLHGKVFVRAESFPGLLKGKWKDDLHRKCASAKYLLIPATMSEDTANHIASIVNKTPVREIPWKKAYAQYAPLLKAAGRKVASAQDNASYAAALKAAFAMESKAADVIQDQRPVVVHAADTISLEKAQEQLSTVHVRLAKITKELGNRAAQRKVMSLQLERWVRSGHLTKQDALRFASSAKSPDLVLEIAAAMIANSGKKASYAGSGFDALAPEGLSREAAWEALHALPALPKQKTLQEKKAALEQEVLLAEQAWKQAKKASQAQALQFVQSTQRDYDKNGKDYHFATPAAKDKTAQEQKVLNEHSAKVALQQSSEYVTQQKVATFLAGLVQSQVLTAPQAERIQKKATSLSDAKAMARLKAAANQNHLYQGPGEGVADASSLRETLTRKASLKEKQLVVDWVSRKLNAGLQGAKLDSQLIAKFGSALVSATRTETDALRSVHEGKAGYHYVDASVYASKYGTEGCDVGSRIHRASAVPNLLKMVRCADCAYANIEQVCQKYAKRLISADEVPSSPVAVKKMAKRASAEYTSDFEFGEVPLEMNAPVEYTSLDGITFEDPGMDLG